MSFFNANALAIMLKPLLSQWITPLEENGTLDKIAADATMIAQSDAIPALGEMVANMKEHNALLRELLERMKADDRTDDRQPQLALVAGAGAGLAGPVGHDGLGMSGTDGPN